LKFFRKLFKSHGVAANRIVTDKLKSYPAALREIGCQVPHDTTRYKNNIAENSHQRSRQQQRQMRQLKSVHHAQRFLSCHGVINNHFRQQRHLLKARHYRFFRDLAFDEWAGVTCAQNLDIAA
jgi:putative transposase